MATLADLADLPRWVAWQTESRGGKGKPTKVPYSSNGRRAKADVAATWDTLEAAKACAATLPKPFGSGGIGIELGDYDGLTLAGIDLDTCRDQEGIIAPWATAILDRFPTYTEVSPSGSGVKLFFQYDPADAMAIRLAMGRETGRKWCQKGGEHPPGIEIYISGRFFAVTGQRHADAPNELQHAALADLEWLIREAGPGMVAAPPVARKNIAKPGRTSQRPAGGDGSRSAVAFKVAAHVKRHGGDFPAFLDALEVEPDTAAWKAEKGVAEGGRELRRCWENAEQAVEQDVLLTEHGVALAFTKRFKDRLRYCHDAGSWYEWTGTHWRQDRKHAAFSFARELVAQANQEAEFKTQAITGKAAFAGGVEKFAQRDPGHAVTTDAWDADLFLLATPGGVVELRTGKLRAARPDDMITKIAAVAPSRAGSPNLWLRFLDDTTGKDDGMIRLLQQWCGYCLTGDTREHALVFGYGPGGNGKSVFLNTVANIMGDYATVAAMDTFTASHCEKHPTDLAMLRGARLVTATETEEGRAWAESRIKQMTGGDLISARFMRQDFFTFRPQFKLTIVGNHKPVLRNVDDAARRRFNLVPFVLKPNKPDRELEQKLRDEWPGILAWMIDGCLDWQRNGLVRPDSVTEATKDYFEAQDHFGRWLAECGILIPTMSTKPAQLLHSFQEWCVENGEPEADNRRLRGMIERTEGLRYVTNKGTQMVRGIGLHQKTSTRGGGGVEGGGGLNP